MLGVLLDDFDMLLHRPGIFRFSCLRFCLSSEILFLPFGIFLSLHELSDFDGGWVTAWRYQLKR